MRILLLLSLLPLAIWLGLLFGRGGFWRSSVLMGRSLRGPARIVNSLDTGAAAWPAVVAVVPARNEREVVALSIGSLLAQDYPGPLSVVLVDDHSDDGTADIARAAARHTPWSQRLQVISAGALPAGWSGKVWAQSEGIAWAERARPQAEYVWLTDADVAHPPDQLAQLVQRARGEGRVLVSEMVRLRCESWAERALIPAFVFFFAKLYPFRWVADTRRRTAGAAGGCMLVSAAALRAAGGIASIAAALIDDCALAAQLKRVGPIRLVLSEGARSLRPNDRYGEIWMMIARTAYTQLGRSPWALSGAVLAMIITYLLPPALAVAAVFTAFSNQFAALPSGARAPLDSMAHAFTLGHWLSTLAALPWFWTSLGAWFAMCCAYTPTLRYYRRSLAWAPMLPVIALFYVCATVDSARRHWSGRGGEWKGRSQAHATPAGVASEPAEARREQI
ncbi:MAG: glycosyltransferase [Janthinobacterium lividum]